jgi:hypothetical protein
MPLSVGPKQCGGRGPLLIMGVARRELRTTFRSPRMFSDKAYKISGTTRDSVGAALGNCIVDLYYTDTGERAARVESDASGAFTFLVGPNLACYVVAYKAGAPDVAGTTVNTLVAA